LFLLLTSGIAGAKDVWTGVDRIVAIGDVHGDFEQFVTILRQAGLIDEQQNWSGGASHLVQTGDVPDRGPDTRKVFDLLMKIEKQAGKAKGYVHPLIGNHDAMNVYGDLRYVHPGEYEAFRDGRSAEVRDEFYKQHVADLKQDPPREGLPAFGPAYRAKWDQEHPLGYFEHRLAFGPRGKYGRWIMNNNVIIKINDIVFLHGGIGPKYAALSVSEINRRARAELQDFAKLKDGVLVDPEGPVWYRGLAQNPEEAEEPNLEGVLRQYGARRIVIGHTVTDGTVMPRFGGRVIMIDVGMSAAYGARQACLIVEREEFFALHRGKKLPLPDDPGKGLLEYLQQAAALDPQPSPLVNRIARLEAQLTGTH
jgi:hypothetical protein